MKKKVLFLAFFLACFSLLAQKNKSISVPLVAEKWTFVPQKVEFAAEGGVRVMKILPGAGPVSAKDLDFSNGTIEFDVKPVNPVFVTMYFRWKDAKENECFYLRVARAGNPTAMDAVQYTPYMDGINMWDIYGQYQSHASFKKDEWNHVKMVISGSQMRVYVNSQTQPTLEIPYLEGNTRSGTLTFEGESEISKLTINPAEVEGLSPLPGIDPTHNDPRYIRSWAVSEPVTTPKNVDFSYDLIPTPETSWQVLEAERAGLVNLTRKFGKSDTRRLVWLKVKIDSDKVQEKKVDFGFSDEVWVFLNGQLAYADKNLYGKPISKKPDGRCSIENTSFNLPLKQGHNELLIGIANDFFGWAMIARMKDMEGITIAPDPTFDARLVKIPDTILDTYTGTYLLPDGRKVVVTKENKALKISSEGFITALLYPQSENKFFMRDYELQMEFLKNGESKVSNFILYNNGKQVMDVKKVN